MSVKLRPHHLLCVQKFTGHGYDYFDFLEKRDGFFSSFGVGS